MINQYMANMAKIYFPAKKIFINHDGLSILCLIKHDACIMIVLKSAFLSLFH